MILDFFGAEDLFGILAKWVSYPFRTNLSIRLVRICVSSESSYRKRISSAFPSLESGKLPSSPRSNQEGETPSTAGCYVELVMKRNSRSRRRTSQTLDLSSDPGPGFNHVITGRHTHLHPHTQFVSRSPNWCIADRTPGFVGWRWLSLPRGVPDQASRSSHKRYRYPESETDQRGMFEILFMLSRVDSGLPGRR